MDNFSFRVLGGCRTCAEPEAVIAAFKDMAVVRQPVERGRGHLGVAEHISPFAEAEVGGDDHHASAFVEFAQQMEQQCPA